MRPLRGTWWYFLVLYYLQNIEKKFWSDLKSDLDRIFLKNLSKFEEKFEERDPDLSKRKENLISSDSQNN